MDIHIDISSSYRNRLDYPNPTDFVILHRQDTLSADFESIQDSNSQQVIIYPPFDTNPLYFYFDTDKKIIENQYLPLMYKTNDPSIIQLDELPICASFIEECGQIIINTLYPRGSIPLGQASQFYTGKYLENFNTHEMRKIISFTYDNSSFIFQTSQVYYASVTGDRIQIGVSPLSSTTIPVSNIYNYYRGKYIQFISGRSKGIRSLIVDYRLKNEYLGIFILEQYEGVIPNRGDTFQIISDRCWYATIDLPFSTSIPSYPAYQLPLPIADIQFTSNIIYSSQETINSIWLSENKNIAIASNDSDIIIIDSIDPSYNNFWKIPKVYETRLQQHTIIYANNELYYISYTNTANTLWSISSLDLSNSIFTDNIVGENYEYTNSIFERYISYLEYKEYEYFTLVTSDSLIFFSMIDKVIQSYQSINISTSIIVHALKVINNIPFIIWSSVDNSTLTYHFTIASNEKGDSVFNNIQVIKYFTGISNTFTHYIHKLDAVVWTTQIITVLIGYDTISKTYTYDIYISDTNGNTWFYSTSLLTLDSIIDSSHFRGTQFLFFNDNLYFFFWDPVYGLSYTYTRYPQFLNNPFFPEKNFSPIINISNGITIRDTFVSNNNSGIFITYITDNTITVLTSEPFTIAEVVPYRIRKDKPTYMSDLIPYYGDNSLNIELDNKKSILVMSDQHKYTLYSSFFDSWFVSNNDKIYYSNDTNTWTQYDVSTTENFNWHYSVQVKESNAINSLAIENSYSTELYNKKIYSIVSTGSEIYAISNDMTYLDHFYILTSPISSNLNIWTATRLFPELSLQDAFGKITIEYAPSIDTLVIVGFVSTFETIIVYKVGSGNWNYVTRDLYPVNPHTVVWSPSIEMFVATGFVNNNLVDQIITITETKYIEVMDMGLVMLGTIPPGTYTPMEFKSIVNFTKYVNINMGGMGTIYHTYRLWLEYNINNSKMFEFRGYQIISGMGPPMTMPLEIYIRNTNQQLDTNLFDILGFTNLSSFNSLFLDSSDNPDDLPNSTYFYHTAEYPPYFGEGFALKSNNGINWELIPYRGTDNSVIIFRSGIWSELLQCICFIGGSNILIYDSTTGECSYHINENIDGFYDIKWSDELELFCAITNQRIYTSTDGISWNLVYFGEDDLFFSISWSSDLRIFLITSFTQLMISFNGINWEKLPYIFLSSTYDTLIWEDTLQSFCGISFISGVATKIYNVANPRNYITLFFNSVEKMIVVKTQKNISTIQWEIPKQAFIANTEETSLPNFLKIEYINQLNLFISIDSDYLWYSYEGNVWHFIQLFGILQNSDEIRLTNITDFTWVSETHTLYIITKSTNYLYYSDDLRKLIADNNNTKMNIHIVPYICTFSKITHSTEIGFIITTETMSLDFLYSLTGTKWEIALNTNKLHRNIAIVWNSYFRCFIGLSDLNDIRNLLTSTDGFQWYTYKLDEDFYQFDFNNDMISMVSDSQVLFSMLQLTIDTETIRTNSNTKNAQLWIYNRRTVYDTNSYRYINDIYNSINYEENNLEMDRPIRFSLPYYVYTEILGDIKNTFNGMNAPFHINQSRCYMVSLNELIVPNRVLETYIGNQISFYPYIYVKIQNERTDCHSEHTMITNHPKMTSATFKLSVAQFTNDPSKLPFILLFSSIGVKGVFNLEAPIRFSIYLPNGELFSLVEKDTRPPEAPNPLLQVSASFKFRQID